MRLSRRGHHILDGLSLDAKRGELTAILGPNGAGKTTAFRCCTGLMTPDGGTVRVLGERPGSPANRTRVGWMPQTAGSWSAITARRLLTYLASLHARPHPVEAMMEELAITPFADTGFRRLSGGQKQALNLAAALIGRPELAVLDEPTAGMDPHARRDTWDLIARLVHDGVSVVMATHDMDEAARATTVHIIDAGRVVVGGDTATLTASHSLEDVFLSHTRRSGRP